MLIFDLLSAWFDEIDSNLKKNYWYSPLNSCFSPSPWSGFIWWGLFDLGPLVDKNRLTMNPPTTSEAWALSEMLLVKAHRKRDTFHVRSTGVVPT